MAIGPEYYRARGSSSSGGWLGLTSENLSDFGNAVAGGGAVTSAITAYFGALARRDSLKSQKLSMEFEQTMASMDARQAEQDANLAMEASRQEIGQLRLRTAQEKGAENVSAAARGVEVGSAGSAAEVLASIELASRIDRYTITRNGIREANALRRQAVNARTRSTIAGVSARNLGRSANSIMPVFAGLGEALEGGGQLARLYGDYRYRYGRR